jgi:hypothetical protein
VSLPKTRFEHSDGVVRQGLDARHERGNAKAPYGGGGSEPKDAFRERQRRLSLLRHDDLGHRLGWQHLTENTIDGSIHQICMDWRHMWEMLAAGRKVYSELKNLRAMPAWARSPARSMSWCSCGSPEPQRTSTILSSASSLRAGRLDELAMHPTVKPVALVADAIKDCSRRGALVLDAFCGSGTILVAAERTGRKARALELDPAYVDVGVRRWQTYTGKAAVLAASGETFETIEEQRAAKPAVA